MAWELANEPECISDRSGDTLVQWAREMSDYIKCIDSNHLVAVGDEGFLNRPAEAALAYNGYNGVDWERLIELPNIDYGTFHLYPESWGNDWSNTLQSGLEWIKVHCDLAKEAEAPVVLEEYGVTATSGKNRNMIYEYWNQAMYRNDADGSMFWILTGIDSVQGRADNQGLYPDYDGCRVVEGSDTAQLISEYAQLMAGELNETDLPPRIYFINPYEEEEIAGNYQVNTTVFPRGKEVQEVTFTSSQSNQTVTLAFTFIDISMNYTYAGIWNTTEEPDNQKVEGVARVTFTDSSVASTSVNVTIANGPVQYVIREQFTFDNDLEGFSNASTYHAEYGSPPIQHSDFAGGSLQANIKWFGDKSWSEITLARNVSDLSDFTKIIYEMYIPKSQLNDTEGTFRPFFALNGEKINVGSSDVPVSNAQVVEIDGAEYYRLIVGSEYEKRSGITELELGLVGAFLDYEGPVYIDNVTLIKNVAASANCVILNNHSGYEASDGKYYLTGEVLNQGPTAVSKPLIFVRFLDDDGIQITTQNTSSLLSVLLAGQKAPFELSVDSARVHSYEFYNLAFSEASDLELGLEISSCNWTKARGNVTVTGVVKNMGTYSANALHVVCTFYDVSGKVVGAQDFILADTPLNPQQQRPFTIIELTDPGRESVYATYQLTAESNEYGIIPEIPFPICIYALFAVSLSAILLRKVKSRAFRAFLAMRIVQRPVPPPASRTNALLTHR